MAFIVTLLSVAMERFFFCLFAF